MGDWAGKTTQWVEVNIIDASCQKVKSYLQLLEEVLTASSGDKKHRGNS